VEKTIKYIKFEYMESVNTGYKIQLYLTVGFILVITGGVILIKEDLDYLQPIEVAEGIYWVGFVDVNAGLYCNPYLVVDGEEAVLIDGGSRAEFSTVMLKILRTGVDPNNIQRLIYQHYDPDLCGNLPHLEAIINNPNLKILSHRENNPFINYYSSKSPKQCIETMGFAYEFASGRRLEFIRTPYSHSPGSFITYDCKTKTLFTSDIFGSYDSNWSLHRKLFDRCIDCSPQETCPLNNKSCHLVEIEKFHRRIMTSSKALHYALEQIEKLDIAMIAPQHGSLIESELDRKAVIKHLKSLEDIGFDYFLQDQV